MRVTKHDFNQLFQQIKQIPLASIKQIKKEYRQFLKFSCGITLGPFVQFVEIIELKKNTGYNFQLYFKIIVLENDQLYARPVVKSPPE